MKEQNIAFNELAFELTAQLCKNDIDCIFSKLLKSNIDKKTLGFWVWDVINEKEKYSLKFRQTLGYENEIDFPDVPDSWMNAIHKDDLTLAIDNFKRHVVTGGIAPYSQKVTYFKKGNRQTVDVLCHGKVVSWTSGKPHIMIGIHMPPDGFFFTNT